MSALTLRVEPKQAQGVQGHKHCRPGIGQDRKPEITLVKNAQKSERPLRSLMQDNPMPQYDERPKAVNAEPVQARAEPDYLDIPAFLRKQAD